MNVSVTRIRHDCYVSKVSFVLLQGIVCSSEAEFRAYDILLNLNEGDILR